MNFLILIFIISIAQATDQYSNFAELAQHEKDYEILVKDVGSSVSVFAIHGGNIEPGTSELVDALDGFNLYHFKGMKKIDPFSLHLTASKFDEPKAVTLAKKSKNCLSIHASKSFTEQNICMGGSDKKMISLLAEKFKQLDPAIEIQSPCVPFPGTHPKNIVNLCQEGGVQLEITSGLHDRLRKEGPLFKKMVEMIKTTYYNR